MHYKLKCTYLISDWFCLFFYYEFFNAFEVQDPLLVEKKSAPVHKCEKSGLYKRIPFCLAPYGDGDRRTARERKASGPEGDFLTYSGELFMFALCVQVGISARQNSGNGLLSPRNIGKVTLFR